MGAFVKGNTIYISKNLAGKITREERRVLLAHEISHWRHKDNIKIIFIRILFFMFPKAIDYFNRRIEIRADREAIQKTKDIHSFITLLDKLKREGSGYPSKNFSLWLADNMRGKI